MIGTRALPDASAVTGPNVVRSHGDAHGAARNAAHGKAHVPVEWERSDREVRAARPIDHREQRDLGEVLLRRLVACDPSVGARFPRTEAARRDEHGEVRLRRDGSPWTVTEADVSFPSTSIGGSIVSESPPIGVAGATET